MKRQGDRETRRQGDQGRWRSALLVSLSPCLLVCSYIGLLASPCNAQTPGPDGVYYTRENRFRIPFSTEPGEHRIRQVQLLISEDRGRSWKQVATAQPEDRSFIYQAKGDGHYWFSVRTVDQEGRAYPPSLEQAQPKVKVCVDTRPPSVILRALPVQDGTAAVEWEIRDDNPLDADSLNLEYRMQGGKEWQQVPVQRRAAAGHQAWTPATNAPLEVRLQIKDRAGNMGEALTTLTPDSAGRIANPPYVPGHGPETCPSAAPAGTSEADVSLVNSKHIVLHFEVKDVGKSGVAAVEVWYTRDGRIWQKYPETFKSQSTCIFEATEEGLYGFTLLRAAASDAVKILPERVIVPRSGWRLT